MPSKIPSTIAEYTILPISLPPTAAYPIKATHHLYLRPHAPKIPTADSSRSLFLVNVPVDSTSAHFRAIFTSLVGAGRFESISFEHEKQTTSAAAPIQGKKRKRSSEVAEENIDTDLPQIWDRELRRSGSTAVVVLVDEKSVTSVLQAVKKLHKKASKDKGQENAWPIWGDGVSAQVPKLGSSRYLAHQTLQYPDPALLQASVDAFMSRFNEREVAAAEAAKRQRNLPDEDGFVTVTRGGRVGPARKEEAEIKRREMQEKEEKRKSEMGDFYRFQMRERRKLEQGELVKRFEEDRRRVEIMKEKRGRFRPET